MSKLCFAKYEGAGNDFILIDDRSEAFPAHDKRLIARLCNRRYGIGADGLILLQLDAIADCKMRIFNSDGSEAESCGNGLRCLARFAQEQGLGLSTFAIQTLGGMVVARVGEHVAIEMEAPSDVRLHLETEVGPIHFARTGVPHAVHIVPDVSSVDLSHLGPLLRRHPLFGPEGANVNVAAVEPDGGVAVRTFERGVEAETLACGTGAAAVASVLSALKGAPGPFSLRCKGGTLTVEVQGESLLLAGPAHKVFEGSIFVCCRD